MWKLVVTVKDYLMKALGGRFLALLNLIDSKDLDGKKQWYFNGFN
jgi:hypothetical protein